MDRFSLPLADSPDAQHRDDVGHKCAVVAVKNDRGMVISAIANVLWHSRNRGNSGSGMALPKPEDGITIATWHDWQRLQELAAGKTKKRAKAGIGHNRYVTSGAADVRGHQQPFGFRVDRKKYAFAFNGNITNYRQLSIELAQKMQHDVDTDVIRVLLQREIAQCRGDIGAVFAALDEEKLDGCFNIVLMDQDGEVYAYRDANGFRPLVHAQVIADQGNAYSVVASEDSAIAEAFPDARIKYHDVHPGEMLRLTDDGAIAQQIVTGRQQHACFFEWVYFAKQISTLDGVNVARLQRLCAAKNARRENRIHHEPEKRKDCIAFGIPQSGILGAKEWAKLVGLEYVQGVTLNPDKPGRTFILSKNNREAYARAKYQFNDDAIRGNELWLGDDSIVRGLTMEILVKILRDKGAKKIHLTLGCPAIIGPCFYGMDFPTLQELLAGPYRAEIIANGGNLTAEIEIAIAKRLGLDSIRFLNTRDMEDAFEELGFLPKNLCKACIRGTPDAYPTPGGKMEFLRALEGVR